MAYYPRGGFKEGFANPSEYFPQGLQQPHPHYQHFHPHHHQHYAAHAHAQHYPPGYEYHPYGYPVGQPYYPYPVPPEAYPYMPPPPVPGAAPSAQNRADARKGLNIVDPKEREQQRQAEANGVAPPQPASKKAALPIKDPLTKQPINLDQPAGQPAPAANPPPQPVQAPQPNPAAPQQPAAAKKKAIPILDPLTRKEVTSKGAASMASPASSSPAPAGASEAELPSSSTSATPAPSSPRSVGNSDDAAGTSQSSEDQKTASSAPPALPAAPAPQPPAAPTSTATEDLVFAPGATWGLPKLPKITEPGPRAPLPPDPRNGVHSAATVVASSSPSAVALENAARTGRRVYDFEFLLSMALRAPPPPEHLKEFEVYAPNARQQKVPAEASPDGKDKRDRRSVGAKPPATGYPGKGGAFEGDLRSKFGRSYVPAPPTGPNRQLYDLLTNRADTAFNVKNARTNTSAEERVLKKVRGILNKVTPEKYTVLFEELWQQLYVEGQVDMTGIVEPVIHTVFDIALDQPKFSHLYADICHHLCQRVRTLKEPPRDDPQDPLSRSDSVNEDTPKASSTLTEFRRFLLNTCQARFEEGSKHQQAIIPADADPEERDRIEKQEQRYKARSLGNIRFVAELFKRSLLSERIMHVVIKTLLMDTDHTDARNLESMETLCEMLNSVGKKLDRIQVKPAMDMYFQQLEEVARTHPVKRIRFLVLNVVELRRASWVPRQDQKQAPEEGKTQPALRSPSGPVAAEAQRATSFPRNSSQLATKEPPLKEKEKEKDKPLVDKDGFQVVGRPKASGWDRAPSAGHQAASQRPNPQSPITAGGTPKAKRPVSPHTPNSRAEPDSNGSASPPSPEERAIPALTDEQVAAKARGLLEEWAADPSDAENALAVLREEIPSGSYSQFLMGMVLGAISQNKRERERAELPVLCGLYSEQELITKDHLHTAFLGAVQKAKRDELWVDVPRLWGNLGGVLCGCMKEEVVDFDVLGPLCDALGGGEEEDPELPGEFLRGVMEAMKREDVDVFDADKATALLATLGKKKKGKPKRVNSLEEFEAAVEKIFALSN